MCFVRVAKGVRIFIISRQPLGVFFFLCSLGEFVFQALWDIYVRSQLHELQRVSERRARETWAKRCIEDSVTISLHVLDVPNTWWHRLCEW